MAKLKHWTDRSTEDFLVRIAFDYANQIESGLDRRRVSRTQFAEKLGVTPGRVSQVLNSPGNLTLRNIIDYARALGQKVAIVAYDDDDPQNSNGPINAQIFTSCWERLGRPSNFFDLQDEASAVTTSELRLFQSGVHWPRGIETAKSSDERRGVSGEWVGAAGTSGSGVPRSW